MSQLRWESDHFRDGRFFNPGVPPHRFSQLLKWIIRRKVGPWRTSFSLVAPPPPSARVNGGEVRATFVNHSTFLIQTEGQNILTDPIWSERASPVSFLGPKRHRPPGIAFDDLPAIDTVLISHNHYDHLDVPTLKKIQARDAPAIFCPLGVARLLGEIGFQQIYELDWWQSQMRPGLRVHCVPAQHFSSRTPFDRNRTLWCGWMLEAAGGNLFFAGDTGFGHHFAAIRNKFEPIRLALLPIGAFKPEWFMGPVHMTPEQAVEACRILQAGTSIAMHFGTFALADDGETEPVDRLSKCLSTMHEPDLVWVLKEGEGRRIPVQKLDKR
ncbi:MAG TPA: MBL fold metallo-hydrolase [Bryobacteraceae bacterium]|nr:MBL fold metallo-hydrolase [Bryobacteraceae bacterium]